MTDPQSIVRNRHYPWLEFEHRQTGRHVVSETRRCTRCGAEETEEAAPRLQVCGVWGVLGFEEFVAKHSRCER